MSTTNPSDNRKGLKETLSFIPRLKQYPLGAVLGIVTAAIVNYARPDLTPDGWMQAPFTLWCIAGAKLHHLAASSEARNALEKVDAYQKSGTLTAAEARRLRAKIAKRDVNGGGYVPAPRKPRGPTRSGSSRQISPGAPRHPRRASHCEPCSGRGGEVGAGSASTAAGIAGSAAKAPAGVAR